MRQKDFEIPLGKRTRKYRFLEILPGLCSYGGVMLLFLLSYFSPMLGAIYLLFIISTTLVKAIGVAYRTYDGYKVIEAAERVDWKKRCSELENAHVAYEQLHNQKSEAYHVEEHIRNLKRISSDSEATHKYVRPSEVYQAVIMVAYNEGIETMKPSIEAVRDTEFPNERIIFVLGYEERGGKEIE